MDSSLHLLSQGGSVDPRTLGCRDLATLALPALFLKSPLNTDFLSVTFSPIHGKYTKSPLRVHNKYTRPMTFENFPARHRTATSLPTCSFAQRSVRGTHPQAQRGSVTVRCSALLGVAYGGGGGCPARRVCSGGLVVFCFDLSFGVFDAARRSSTRQRA